MHTVVLHLGKKDAGMPLSHVEFADARFDEPWRYERVHGRLVVMSPSGHEHAVTNQPLRNHLGAFQLQHPDIVELVTSEAWIRVDEETDRIADIGVYLRRSAPVEEIPHRVPDLVIEVVSPSAADRRRDYKEKRSEFERLGVPEYIVVDRFQRRMTILRLSGGKYAETALGPDDMYTTPLLPGLQIPLVGIL